MKLAIMSLEILSINNFIIIIIINYYHYSYYYYCLVFYIVPHKVERKKTALPTVCLHNHGNISMFNRSEM